MKRAPRRGSPWALAAAVFFLLAAFAATVGFCMRPVPAGLLGLTNYVWAYVLFDMWRRR